MQHPKFWGVGAAVVIVAAALAAPRILNMTDQGQVLFFEDTANGANSAAIQAPASLAASYTLTLPPDDGNASQFLQTDGSGVLIWNTAAGVSLDAAYDGGDFITVDVDSIDIDGSIATPVVDIAGSGAGDTLTLAASGAGNALSVTAGPTVIDGTFETTATATMAETHFNSGEPWFDVKAFGATGDGVTDDTAAIAAAYAALDSAGGGILFFPPGNYLMTTVLTVSSDEVWIRGAGANLSQIQTDGNDAIDVQDGATANFVNNFVLSDIRLLETDAADTTSVGIEFNTYARYSRIERCRIQSFAGGGIIMHGGLNNRIDQCFVASSKAGTTGPNLYVTRSAEDTAFTTLLTQNNYFAAMGAAGVYSTLIEDGTNWTSILDIWENSAGVALRVQQSTNIPAVNCADMHVVGGHWESNAGNDIEIHDVQRFCKFGGAGATVVDTWSVLAASLQNFYEVNGVTGAMEGLRKIVIANAFGTNDISTTAGLQLGGIDGNELPEFIMATESDTSGRTQRIRYFAENSGGGNVEIGRQTVTQGAADATAPLATYALSLTPAGGAIAVAMQVSGAPGKTMLALPNTGTDVGLTIGGDTNLFRSAANLLKTDDSLTISGFETLEDSEVTIASGVVTVTRSHHFVDTESDDASDDLDTINGVSTAGTILILRAASDARTVVIKDGTGNLATDGDFSLNNSLDRIILIYDSANSVWSEISRSDNGA